MNYEALDIETIWKDGIAKPICIAISKGEKILYKGIKANNVESNELALFLLEKCSSNKIYYVHNLTFEAFVFLPFFIKMGVKFKIISSNKTVYSMEIFWKKKKIKMRCSYKLTMLSLKNLAKLAGEEEKGIFPYSILNENLEERMFLEEKMFNNKKEFEILKEKHGNFINTYDILKEYCINDVNITKKSIIKYWKIIEEGGLTKNNRILTAAKLSIENYFKDYQIIKKKIHLKYDRLIRKGYYGGRTEVFGNLNIDEIALHFDWSGMYSQCMMEKVLGGEIYESNIILNTDQPGFYWIKFKQDLDFPILPIKLNKLMFVNGEFEGWYWFEEIKLAKEHGVKILNVTKMISCQYYETFIKDFVEKNNNIRKISPLHKLIGKNNNNTFYGRLGMNPERLEEEIMSEINNISDYEKIVEINGAYVGYKKKEKSVSNVLISASITSKARIKLYKGIMEVIKNGGRILYTDTDSIIAAFHISIYEKALDREMGEVYFDSTKNDTIIKDAVFAMPKTYALSYMNGEEIVKIKGFNAKPDFKTFKEHFYEKKTLVTQNIEWNKKDLIIKNIIREKQTNLHLLDKRRWKFDMKNTEPIKF